MTAPLALGTRLEPFVTPYLLAECHGAALRLHAPQKREVVLETNKPWECSTSGYFNLCQDGDRLRLYYRGNLPKKDPKADTSHLQTAALAESTDGVRFTRPALGVVKWGRATRNNLIWQGKEAHNFCAFRDENPACPPDERYKAVGGGWMKLAGLVSADGVHWRRLSDEPLPVPGAFDSLNVPLWDRTRGCYWLFSRFFTAGAKPHVRAIQSCTSPDFRTWTAPVPHVYAPGVPMEQFYTNATVPCPGAEHLFLSFPKRFVPDRQKDPSGMTYPGKGLSDAVFMASRDGVHWDRTFMEAWVRPDEEPQNWTHRGNMPAVGIFELRPGEWSMYISEHYGWATSRVRRLTMRRHGIASLAAGYAGGEALTHPLTFDGARLHLNLATSAVGGVRVEVQELDGRAVPGFALADMEPLYGNELDAVVTWKGGADLAALRGRPVRLRLWLKDADVFSLRFGE